MRSNLPKDDAWEPHEDLADSAKQSLRLMDAFLTYLLERKRTVHGIRQLGPLDLREADRFFRDSRGELASLNASERWAERERARAERRLSVFQDPVRFRRWAQKLDEELARRTRRERGHTSPGR